MVERPKDIKLIVAEVLERETAEERAAYLTTACGDDAALRAEVESLLRLAPQMGDFLEAPILGSGVILDEPPVVEGPGSAIGRYKLLEKIGEGGMAVVYMAEQTEPIRRKVALKIIKLGMDTKQVIARFEAERQALALMDHPHIAKVLDAGATETGRPYFVMELVQGVSITEYCDKNRLNTKDRLALFLQICSAVQHAHTKGIIHRDIKPSNVMVTHHDGTPVPKVIDFGIAKATNQRLTEKTLFTRYAHIIGTPAYMSPEQAELSDLDIDTRSDIYSLGVLLYELLTGTTPFSEEELRKAGYLEMQRIIREQEPVKPSTRIITLGNTSTEIAERRGSTPDLLRKAIRGDLDWIVMKSLEKDRTQRYETASALAGDVRRHLASEPVLARAPSAVYRTRKFFRRHQSLVLAALGMVAISIGAAVLLFQWNRGRQRLEETEGLRDAAILSQARERYAKADHQAALETIRSILESRHIGPEARLLKAGILLDDRRFEEARILLMALLNERREITGAAYSLLARHLRESESLDAKKLRQIEEYRQKAEGLFPGTTEAYYLQAITADTIKKQLTALDEALALAALDATPFDPMHYECRRLRAFTYYASRKYAGLRDDALVMTILRPRDPLGYSLRAVALRELGQYEDAIAEYDHALALMGRRDPQYVDLSTERCETLLRMDDYERVIAAAQEGLKSSPDALVPQYYLFSAWTALGDYEKAQSVFQQIVSPGHEARQRFWDWCARYIFDTLAAGRSWHPADQTPAGAAFLSMVEAEENYRSLSAKARCVIKDCFSARWSPDGKKLAFSMGAKGYSGVGLYDPATKETELLIIPGGDPRWSPDGRFIAFVRDSQVLDVEEFATAERPSQDQDRAMPDEEVWIMNSDGSEPRRLAAGRYPSWGQDSTCVYYHSRINQTFNSICIVERDAKPRQITACSYGFPSVSPDGRRVAYLEGQFLRVKDLDSQRVVAEWAQPSAMAMPGWSPTGDELCVGMFGGVGSTSGLWIYRLGRREPVKVLGGPMRIRGSTWALDGTKLVFHLGPPYCEAWTADLDPKVSTIDALAPAQTPEEHWRDMVRLCTRRIETDPLDAVAYSDRAQCYDRLHERLRARDDMRRWSAAAAGRSPSGLDVPPARVDLAFGKPAHLDAALQFFPTSNIFVTCFSSDNREMFVYSDLGGGQGHFDLWVLKRATPQEAWGPPENLGPIVNSPHFESNASISGDGLELYFGSDRPGGHGNIDVYVTRRATRTSSWGPPTNLDAKVNSAYAETGVSVSSDGLELYFSSGRPDGYGVSDIYVSKRARTQDPWGDPVNLGVVVNSPYYDDIPRLSPDGLLLLFQSQRPGRFGIVDLWMTRRANRSAPWEPVVNLGPMINSPEYDCQPCLAPDGSALYFAWDSPDRRNTPWKAPIIPIGESGEPVKGERDQK
jgi:serine/threonine protein kinase/Tol biopolymer transport system component/tetratricopeptide (TPR) repeat protein